MFTTLYNPTQRFEVLEHTKGSMNGHNILFPGLSLARAQILIKRLKNK